MMNKEIAWRLDHVHLPSTYLDALGYCEVQGIVVGVSEAEDFAELLGALPAQPAEPRAQ